MNTNKTKTFSASGCSTEPWCFDEHQTNRMKDASGKTIAVFYGDNDAENMRKSVACVNALAGMEPGAVAGLVAASESLLESIKRATSSCPREIDPESKLGIKAQELRAALAALKGGAK